MYQGLYDLLSNAIFDTTSLTGYQDLVITMLSTIGVIWVIAIPFFIVYQTIKFIFLD